MQANYIDQNTIKLTFDTGLECYVPDDMANRHRQMIAEWESAGNVIGQASAIPSTDYSNAIQSMLDGKARERGYDSIFTAISYLGDENEKYAAEAAALKSWRSTVWTYSNAELDRVLAAERPQPTVADFLIELETAAPFAWPTL